MQADALIERYRIKPGHGVSLDEFDTRDHSGLDDKATTKNDTAEIATAIDTLQDSLYAEGRRALLVILQGMDTSGQGRHDPGRVQHHRPARRERHPFRQPSEEELAHDFLWRAHWPARGAG